MNNTCEHGSSFVSSTIAALDLIVFSPFKSCFSVGCTTAFGIVTRLDRLMIATKELVGEQYHIHGVGLPPQSAFPSRPASVRPGKDA